MEKKIKIRVIDSTKARRNDIRKTVNRFNNLEKSPYINSIYDGKDQAVDLCKSNPDLFLLHISDHKTKTGKETTCEYLEKIDRECPDALIVLYSGGGITLRKEAQKEKMFFKLITNRDNEWNVGINNGDRFCIVENPVEFAKDLRLEEALEKYGIGDREKFFKTILYGFSSDTLPALYILCEIYLTIYFKSHKEKHYRKSKDIIHAHDEIRWRNVLWQDDMKHFEEIEKPEWWQNIFKENKGKSGKAKERLKKNLEGEWENMPDEIMELVDVMFENKPIQPKTAAKAFSAVRKKLKG